MKKCGPRGWCVVMTTVLQEQAYTSTGLRISKHPGHHDGIEYRLGNEIVINGASQENAVHLSLCPWCGASLLPKPVVVESKYRGKR